MEQNKSHNKLIPVALLNTNGKILPTIPLSCSSYSECDELVKRMEESLSNIRKEVINLKVDKSVISHWNIGREIHSLQEQLKKLGCWLPMCELEVACKKSSSFFSLHFRFYNTYNKKEMLDSQIKWEMYRILSHVHKSSDREKLEKEILKGLIKNQGELMKRKHELEKSVLVMNDSQKKTLEILKKHKKEGISLKNLSSYSNLPECSVRGRVADLRHKFGYTNILTIDKKYYLRE